jgi:multidrug resistance protein, MATE family
MISSGLAAATTIKVSHLRGQNNLKAIKHSVYASMHMVTLFMMGSVTLFLLFRFKIPALFVPDAEVIAIAGGLMLIASMFQLFDGLQVVSLGALRGLEDVKVPMIMLIIAYFPVALPVSYLMAFNANMGPQGVWTGYMAGLMTVGIMLFIRFRWKVNKMQDKVVT